MCAADGAGSPDGPADPVAVEIGLLQSHRQWRVRAAAARSLGRIGYYRDRDAISALHVAASSDASKFVRDAASAALAEVQKWK